jgi:hypothetical protein
MTRRNWTTALVGALSTVHLAHSLPTDDDMRIHHGYKLIWTGWKLERDSARISAQWLAYPLGPNGLPESLENRTRHCLFVSAPGTEGSFYPGACFDLRTSEDQMYLLEASLCTKEQLEREKQKQLARMARLIDSRDWALK